MSTEKKKQQDRERMRRIRHDQKQNIEQLTDLVSRMVHWMVDNVSITDRPPEVLEALRIIGKLEKTS